jgi:(p)ppGpp synthase/HD superfamily hydrolase
MHALAEGGHAAHWKYKKDGTVDIDDDDPPQGVLVSLTDALSRRGIGG